MSNAYKTKYNFRKLDGTLQAAVDGYASICCDLWPLTFLLRNLTSTSTN